MSWRPGGDDASWGPSSSYRSSSGTYSEEQQPARDRLRLPPLSTLISSSTHQSPTQRSPLTGHTAASLPIPPRLSPKESQIEQQSSSSSFDRHYQQATSSLRHSESTSYLGVPLNLPPLTSLSLRSRTNRSPSLPHHLSSSTLAGPLPPLPSRLHSSSTYSPASRPSETYAATPATTTTTSTASSSSSIGPTRRRINSASTVGRPYQRPYPTYDYEYFNHIQDIFSYAFRINEEAASHLPSRTPSRIANGDIQGLLYHLNKELDMIERRDPRLSYQLAFDAGLTSKKLEISSPSSSSSSSFHPGHLGGRRSEQEEARLYHEETDLHSPSRSYTSPNLPYYSSGLPVPYGSVRRRGMSVSNMRLSPTSTSPHQLRYSPLRQHQQYISSHSGETIIGTSSASAAAAASTSATSIPPKRVRKRKDEIDQSCLSCCATETPEWRKGPTGPRTLCNACGLLFAKQLRKKDSEAQARGERSRGSKSQGLEIMSNEEKERSLLELKIAVNARVNISPSI